MEKLNNIVLNIPRNICCGYLLKSPHQGYSNRNAKHTFLRVNKKRKGFLSLNILLYVGILYSGKFFLMAEPWETNAVVITRFFCIMLVTLQLSKSLCKEICCCKICKMFFYWLTAHALRRHQVTGYIEQLYQGLTLSDYSFHWLGIVPYYFAGLSP